MRRLCVLALALLCCSGCRQASLSHQPVARNLRPNNLTSWTRQPVPGTVERGQPDETDPNISGTPDRTRVSLPVQVNRGRLDRGRERFDIFCAPCHGRTGYGDGLIVQRGFPRPPSLHDASLRGVGEGYLVYVMTRGYGRMASYGDRIEPADRWLIAAYVKCLQFSQDFPLAALSDGEQARLNGDGPSSPPSESSPRPRRVPP